LTNNRISGPPPCGIYKDRWQIEIFFKILKQNLKIKTFVGTTANASRFNLDSIDRHFASAVSPTSFPSIVVSLSNLVPCYDESLYPAAIFGAG